ncbi:hypothetical protein KC19_2G031600 [Ceratodon purpureus]|uniref:Proline dehydrogenase n=1 Tax=Ceratodon purpureus TaxID=3225 RepID=A0A8T0ISR3_CERPU|nr:hypothetical protein KC19_2G031600 [Ceratodon purpureus]
MEFQKMAWREARGFVRLSSSCKGLARTHPDVRGVTTKADLFTTQNASEDILQSNKGEELCAKLTSKELLKSLLNLQLVAYEPVVDLSIKILTSNAMKSPLFRAAVLPVLKRTAYSHFCAGETVEECGRTLTRMWELGLRGIMGYGLEDATDSESCDENLEKFEQVVLQTSQLPPDSVSSACVKISAICPIHILERASDLLRWQHVNKDFNLPWKQDVIPVLAEGSPMYHVQPPPKPLTKDEEKQLDDAHNRLTRLCQTCESEGIPLLVDAEYSEIQPAVDYFIFVAAGKFNRGRRQPLVYGTMQTYLKDSFPRLSLAVKGSHHRGLSYGVKIVRGAYISREKALASSLGVPSPIHPNIEATHRNYNLCAAFMLEQAASGDGAVVLATHNMNSGRAAAAKVQELGFSRGNPRVQFAQLKGMADVLSLSLVHAGFRVSKMLPFGSVPEFIPFIVRRAEENRGLLGNTAIDRQYLRAELTRRLQGSLTL